MRIAIVTGASSGLGTEFAQTIAEQEKELDEIWLIARRRERMEALAASYAGRKFRIFPLDLTSMEDLEKLEQILETEQPDIQLLINNAGYCGCGSFEKMPARESAMMIDLNTRAPILISRACLPYMHKGGSMILTCSVSSFTPIKGQAVYSASKAAIRYFGHALHEEQKNQGVHVLVLCPGNMNTEMNVQGDKEKAKAANLPYLDMKKMTVQSIARARAGKTYYTPGAFYKFYRLVGKVLPFTWLTPFTGGYFND